MINRTVMAEDQIQRTNQIISSIENLQKLDFATLTQRPDPKQWSIIEVIGHMNSAYYLYEARLDQKLQELPASNESEEPFKVGRKTAFFIRAITPQGSKRPMKMKTMKVFEPVFTIEELDAEKIEGVFNTFFNYKKHLKSSIQKARSKAVNHSKINSALGPLVKFYLPEAFEFLIGHDERHLVQIAEIQAAITQNVSV
ncbi:MAG: hypothetical protein Sapg2KO_22570 [Saprospiraceae bacterium]